MVALQQLPAYTTAQSAFKISDSPGSRRVAINIIGFCFLQEICISFLLHCQRENQREICPWSSLWVSVLDPD